MTKIAMTVVVCGVTLLGLCYGCGARMEVAKDKVMQKIDSMLDSMDVKRKEIELGVNGMKKGIDTLRKAKIKAQVLTEYVQREAKPVEEKLASTDGALKILRGHLEAAKPVEIAGKTYTPGEVKDLTGRVLAARKTFAARLAAFQECQTRMEKVTGTLEGKQGEAEQKLAEIESQIGIIDCNRIALTGMKASAEAMGSVDEGLSNNFDHLQAKVKNLFVDVETELRWEDARWAHTATKEIDTVESLVKNLQTSSDMIREIDLVAAAPKR